MTAPRVASSTTCPRMLLFARGCAIAAFVSLLPAVATAAGPAVFRQVTNTPFGVGMFEPSLSADGSRVAFRTAANLVGQNPDGSFEVYVYDRRTGVTRQVTSTPGGSGSSITVPMITPDGSAVIFRSGWDFFSNSPGSTFQLWEVNVATGVYRRVTSNPASTPVTDPRISGDGKFLTFLARINPTGQNPDGSLEVFRIDRVSGVQVQISNNVTVAAQFPDINSDGSRIVWGDRANYDGTNGNGGLEIWMWDAATNVVTSVTRQTSGVVETNFPRIDAAGRYVAFVSLFDFSGGNATGRKVFVADTQTQVIRRITNPGVGGSGTDYPDVEISPDGSTVYFESNINLAGTNGDGNRELFAYDIASQSISQVTNTTGGATIVALSDDATRRYLDVSANNTVAYRTDATLDPFIANGDNLEMFLGACAFATLDASSIAATVGDAIQLNASVSPADPSAAYQWRRNGVALSDGGSISGATTATLSISPASLTDTGEYDAVITGSCGTLLSTIATVFVSPCPADFTQDGFIDFTDFDAFVSAFEAGDPAADFNADGFSDFTDFDAFVAAFESGC